MNTGMRRKIHPVTLFGGVKKCHPFGQRITIDQRTVRHSNNEEEKDLSRSGFRPLVHSHIAVGYVTTPQLSMALLTCIA